MQCGDMRQSQVKTTKTLSFPRELVSFSSRFTAPVEVLVQKNTPLLLLSSLWNVTQPNRHQTDVYASSSTWNSAPVLYVSPDKLSAPGAKNWSWTSTNSLLNQREAPTTSGAEGRVAVTNSQLWKTDILKRKSCRAGHLLFYWSFLIQNLECWWNLGRNVLSLS